MSSNEEIEEYKIRNEIIGNKDAEGNNNDLDQKKPTIKVKWKEENPWPIFSNYSDHERARVRYYIDQIKKINPELANSFEKRYQEIIKNASSDLKSQEDAKTGIDNLLKELIEYYNKYIYEPNIVNRINYTIQTYKKKTSNITLEEMIGTVDKYRTEIYKLIEYASNRDEAYKRFAELQAICIAMFHKYYKLEANKKQIETIMPDSKDISEAICLVTFLGNLEIDDSYFQYTINSIDIETISTDLKWLYNDKLWGIVAEYFNIIERVEGEVVTENENSTSLAPISKPNNNWFSNFINKAIQLVTGIITDYKKAQKRVTIEKSDTALNPKKTAILENETDKDDRIPRYDIAIDEYRKRGVCDFLYKLSKMNLKEMHFPEESMTDKDVWVKLYATVLMLDKNTPNKVDGFYNRDRIKISIMLKDTAISSPDKRISQNIEYKIGDQINYIRLFQPNTENIDYFRSTVKSIWNIHTLHLLGEIDLLFGTNCIYDYLAELIEMNTRNDGINVEIHKSKVIRSANKFENKLKYFFPDIEIQTMIQAITRDKYKQQPENGELRKDIFRESLKPESTNGVLPVPPENNLYGFKSSGRVFRRGEDKDYIIPENAEIAGFSAKEPSIGPSEGLEVFLSRDE